MPAPDVYIHPTAEVHASARIGRGTRIWNGVQVRERAVIGQDCNLGKDVYVDLEVKLGDRVRVQNRVSFFHGVEIADDVFVGPHVCFTNDMFPRAFNRNWQRVDTRVEKGASIGAAAAIRCGVTIGEYAMVGLGAVVIDDVPAHALVVGNPARVVGHVCRCGRRLPRAAKGGKRRCTHCGETVTLRKK
jgi:acetyltransferase-like isoleucine patch superfamily enzyme